jgi:dolichyl-phosphate-mannose--protein O-mannosyl transferase
MSGKRWVFLVVLGWVGAVTVLHLWLNLHVFDAPKPEARAGPLFRVGFLPVT